jgi:hypothetical protein
LSADNLSKFKQKQRRNRRTIGFMPLEPRIMYDGAAAASAAIAHHHAADHHGDHNDPAANPHTNAPPPPAAIGAPGNAGQWQHNNQWEANGTLAVGGGQWERNSTPNEPMPQVYTWVKDPTEIVFIDQQAPDWQLLANGVSPGIEVVVLNPNSDGVDQIADFLSRLHDPNLTTVDIVAHGSDGMLFLGNTVLDNDTVGQYATQLGEIGAALQPGGDLMLYGCDVATDASGLIFLDQITQETGVNVAASTGPVGSAAEGGTWELDASSGLITAVSPFTAATMAAYPDVLNADIFSVISGGLADGILYGTDNNGSGDGPASGVTNDYSGSNTDNAVFQASNLQQIQLDPQDGLYFVLLDDTGTGGPNKIIELSLTSLLNNPSSSAAIVATPFQDTNTNDSANAFYVDVADNVIFVNDIIGNNLDNPTPTADDLDVLTFSGAHFSGNVTTTVHNLGAQYLDGMVVDPLTKTAYFYFTETSETIVGPYGKTTGGATSFGHFVPGNPTGTSHNQKDVYIITENALFQASWTGSNTNLGTVTLTQLPISGGQTIGSLTNNVPTSDGIIEDLAVDNQTGTLYFDTDSEDSSAAGIYSYNGTSHAIGTVYTANGAVDGGLTNFIIDPQTDKYYVTTVNGSTNDIYDGSLSGGNPSLFIDVDTVDSALANGGSVGMALDNSPTLTTASSTVTADQDGPAVTVNSGALTITDSDTTEAGDNSALASATVSITTNFHSGDTLAVPTADLSGTNITQSYNSATGVLTLSGIDTIAHYQTVLDDVTFSTTSGVGQSPRTVTFAASDGLLSGSGTDTVDVLVLPVVGATGNTVDFYQSQGSTGTALDSSITVTDGNGANISSATATISSGFLSGDTLSIPAADLTSGKITGTNISFSVSGDQLTLSGSDTAAHYQQALRDITYDFSGDPTNAGADKTRTITWSVTDADSVTSAAGSTTTLDAFETPALAAGAGFTAPVMNSSGALAADSDLTVTDGNTTGSAPVATVTISNGFDTGDTLSFNGGVTKTFTDGGQISSSFNATTHVLTLTGTAGTSAADFQAAFEAVQFNTTNTNSNNGTRTLTWQFNDDAGNSANNSNSLTTNFNVEFPPTIGSTGNTAEFYQSQASPTTLDSAITVADPNVAVTSATVTIGAGYLSGDTLSFNGGTNSESFFHGPTITASFSGGVLTLTTQSGIATAAEYQTALESVTYSFTGDPTNAGADKTRTITWSVTDANNQTSIAGANTTLDVFALPIVSVGAAGTPTETSASGAVTADSTLSITDYNGTTIHNASVQITSGDVSSDTLTINGTTSGTINNGANGAITYTFSGSTLTLTGTDTVADYQSALDLVKFSAVSPNSGARTLTWEVNDQAGGNTNNSAALSTNVNVAFGPTITTTASSNVTLSTAATTLTDSAVVAGGTSPTGTLTFTLTGPGNTTVDTETVTVSGDGTYSTPTGYTLPTSGTVAGTYTWHAAYGGDGNNSGSSDQGGTAEQTVVSAATPTVSTTQQPASAVVGSAIADKVTVSGGFDPTGTVTFKLYNNPNGTGTALFTDTETAVNGVATSASYTATSTGTDYWVATYNGDSNNNAVTSGTALEPVTVTAASPSISTTQQPASAVVGSVIADKVTVSGGYNPTGTVTFNLYNNPNGTGAALFTDTETTVNGSATSASYTATSTGTDYWVAMYNGDSNNNAVTSGTAVEPVTVTAASPAIATTPSLTAVTLGTGSATLSDTATLTGGYNESGTITFTLYEGSTLVDTETVSVSGNGSYSTPTGFTLPTSGTVTGTYQWDASYSGDANDNSVSDVNAAGEQVTVSAASPTVTTTPSSTSVTLGTSSTTLNDTATLAGGYNDTGTITFTLYNGSTLVDTETVSVTGNGSYTTPTGFTLPTSGTETGTYQWDASYSGDANNNAFSDTNNAGEQVTVSPASPTLSTTPNMTAVTLGASPVTLTDTAVVGGGYNDTGTITFTLYQGSTLVDTETVSVSGNGSYTTATGYTLPSSAAALGTYQWDATYNGDANNNAVSDLNAAGEQVNVVHTPPTVTAGATATFNGGSTTPSTLDSGLTVSDPDSGGNLSGATVSITSGFATGDTLNFSNQNGITGIYSSTTGVLTLTGTASIANYQTALDSISYNFSPTNGDPTGGGGNTSRTISWVASDNIASSTPTTSTLNVVHTAPTVTAGATATFTGGGSAVTLDGTLTTTDVDSAGDLTGATVSITSGFISGDTLNFTNQSGITGSYNSGTGVLTLSGTSSVANYQAALDSITYGFSPSNGDPTGGGGDTARTISWTVTDGSTSNGSSNTATSTLDTVHVAPTVTAGGTVTFDGGGSPVTLDGTLTVSDVDSAGNLTGATVSISSGFLSGDTLNFTNQSGISGVYNSATGVLTLTGTSTLADYQTALDSVTYNFTPTNGDPTGGGSDTARTISWAVTDGSTSNGTSTTGTSTLDTVHVAPAVTAGGTVTFDGGGSPVTLDGTATVSDVDSGGNLTGATVSISSGLLNGDTLNFTDQNGITGSYDATTGTLTLTGTSSIANYQTALDSISYSFSPSNGEPTGNGTDTSRTISWTVTDGSTSNGTGNTGTSTLDTVHVAPTVTAGATATFDGGGSPVTLDGTLTVTDPDSGGNLSLAVVSISSGFTSGDTLNFTNQNGIAGSYDAVHGILTLTGTSSLANYQAALDSVTYSFSPSNGDPTGGGGATSRTINWTADDGNSSDTAGSTLNVVHTAPAVVAGATATFDGGGSPVTLDGTLTLADADSGGNLTGATVSISGGLLSGDSLNFSNQNGITGSYDSTTGALTLTGTSSVANYQTALDSITYSFSPTNGDPTAGGDTARVISWTVTDGSSSNGTSNAATSTLETVHIAPTVTAGATATFEISGPAVTADGALTLADPDSGGDLTGATVKISSGFQPADDSLNFTNQNGITGSFNVATGVLTLSGMASVADYQAALDSVTFSSTTSSTGNRTLSWTVNDGATSHSTSNTGSSTIDLVVGPQITAGATATFDGGGSPVALDGTLTVTDAASANLDGATVSISSGFLSGDVLNFTNQNSITGSYDAVHGILTLTGTASVADYQTALDSIAYSFSPSNGDPTGGGGDTSRTISWAANDGVANSVAVTSTLDTVHVAPTVTAGGTATFDGGGSAVTLDGTVSVSDVDSAGNLTGATVSISANFLSGDVLNFTNQNGITGSYDAVHGILTLTGAASVADYQTALDTITYSFSPSNGDPTGGGGDTARTISWTVTDGSTSNGTSNTATSTLDTVHVAPTVTAGGTVTFDGGGSPVTLDSTLTVSDVDSDGQLTGATVSISANFLSGDVLNFTNQSGITGSYDAVHGILTLTGTSSIANYQTALDSVTYSFSPSNGDPTGGGGDIGRTISWTVTDGSTSNGTSNPATSALDTVHVAPTVTASGTATFDGGGPAVTLDGTLSLSDVDSSGQLSGATVSISSGYISGDTLNFTNQNGITLLSNAGGVLTLTGTASLADYQNALDSITYSFSPSDGDPTNGGGDTSRTISWTVTDGSTSNGTSNTATSTLDVVHVAPTLTTGGTVTYTQNGSAQPLDTTLSLSDPDSGGLLTGATVQISSGFLNGDTLTSVTTGLPSIIASYDSSTGVLTLSGTDTLADYQAVLRSVSFSSTSPNPSSDGADSSRTITWTINDGVKTNPTTETSTVDVHAVPTIVAGNEVSYTASLSGGTVVLDPGIGAYDGTDITSATVAIATNFTGGDTLSANTTGTSIHASYDPATGVLTLSGNDTPQAYDQVLASVTYGSSRNSNALVTIDWQMTDQNGLTSAFATTQVTVTGIFGTPLSNNSNNGNNPIDNSFAGPFGPFFQVVTNVQGGAGSGPFGGIFGFGPGQGVLPIHADINVTVTADGSLDFSIPVNELVASLDGDVVSITASLIDGQPLPSWLHFDATDGKFAGLVPDDILTGSIGPDGNLGGGGPAHGPGPMGQVLSDKITIEVIARDSLGDISIIDFTINLKPENGTHHGWNLPPGLRIIAPPATDTRHAQAVSPHDLLAPVDHAAANEQDLHAAERSAVPAHGRAGLTAQLGAMGWRGMQADRMALLESLRHAAAGLG